MADLLDIAPSTAVEVVKINGERYTVRGLHGNAMASIAARFPELGVLLSGGANIGPRLIERFGDAIGPIIAAGCGHLGNEKAEKIASELLVEDQLNFISAILRLTFPNGLSRFIEALANFMGGKNEEAKPVKVRLSKSPSPSQLSSGADSSPTMQ